MVGGAVAGRRAHLTKRVGAQHRVPAAAVHDVVSPTLSSVPSVPRAVGDSTFAPGPASTWPELLSPQHHTVPLPPAAAHVEFVNVDTAVMPVSPGSAPSGERKPVVEPVADLARRCRAPAPHGLVVLDSAGVIAPPAIFAQPVVPLPAAIGSGSLMRNGKEPDPFPNWPPPL